jgi:hypothetical protein
MIANKEGEVNSGCQTTRGLFFKSGSRSGSGSKRDPGSNSDSDPDPDFDTGYGKSPLWVQNGLLVMLLATEGIRFE